jgi:hypothetical protein
MAVQGGGVELREAVDLVDVAVQAVADGNINQAIVRAQGHSGLGTLLGQGVQTSAGTTAQNDTEHSPASCYQTTCVMTWNPIAQPQWTHIGTRTPHIKPIYGIATYLLISEPS